MGDGSSSAKPRSRASAACCACRKSRNRCIIGNDESQCVRCVQADKECIFDHKDGRKDRPSGKVDAKNLSERVKQLESLLESTRGQTSDDQIKEQPLPSEKVILNNAAVVSNDRNDETHNTDKLSVVKKLVPSPVRFDMASGRVRCFGPTTIMHLLTQTSLSKSLVRKETHWPICTIIRDLSPDTHDYLMDLYFRCHNDALHLVHQDAFDDDHKSGSTQFYSTFLHLTLLATGFRYADKSRDDVKNLEISGTMSSTLHQKAKSMATLEIEKPGGIPSIQALFLLGDLECAVGKDDTGWQFAGMSFRLVFDVGLHVDPASLRLSEREAQIRHMVLWACILNDKYWSLYLGRPTAIKIADLAPACLSKDFGPLMLTRLSGHAKKLTTKIYESLLRLMDLVGQLCDLEIKRPGKTTDDYFKVAAVELELTKWIRELPPELQWTQGNIETMPASFFLLHSQYHAALILLYSPYIKNKDFRHDQYSSAKQGSQSRFLACSREICVENSKRVASIFQQYQKRFNLKQVFVTGLQHVATASTALIVEIMNNRDTQVGRDLLPCLASLQNAMSQMAETYQPAILMSSVIERILTAFRAILDGTSTVVAPSHGRVTVFDTDVDGFSIQGCKNGTRKRLADTDHSISGFKRPRNGDQDSTAISSPTPDVFSYLSASWLEDLNAEDTAFLNLVGLDQLKQSELLTDSSVARSSGLELG